MTPTGRSVMSTPSLAHRGGFALEVEDVFVLRVHHPDRLAVHRLVVDGQLAATLRDEVVFHLAEHVKPSIESLRIDVRGRLEIGDRGVRVLDHER